jgi:hypothetical protein
MNEEKKDRRDPIRTIKTKNPVAKNANAAIGGGAAGAHKDKKRAEKNGDVKHKKAEFAENYEVRLARQLNELSIDTLKSYKEKRKTQQDAAKAAVPNPRTGDKDWIDQAVRHINMNTAQRKINRKEKEMAEEFDSPEYNDEAGMAESNLHTLKRSVDGLLETINDGDNLPEWCQEKIAKAEMMLVSVWDYLLSQKEQGINPKVSEASALEKFRKGSTEREKKHADIEAKRKAKPGDSAGAIDRLAKHMDNKTESLRTENPCWKGYKPVGTKKKGGRTVPNCVPKEGWTHDSLADELFEHERTYEEKLQNQLNKLTKR